MERRLWNDGDDVVVGIDEVGRGSWAGPLTVAAAVIPQDRRVYGVRDSKMLRSRRESACSIASCRGALHGPSDMPHRRNATARACLLPSAWPRGGRSTDSACSPIAF